MRIAYISYEYPPDSSAGGIATYMAQAAAAMLALGHEVEVFASSPLRGECVMVDGVRVHWVNETNVKDFGIVAGHVFSARHKEAPFDIIEGPEYNADARKAHQLHPEVPLVVKLHTPSLMSQDLCAASKHKLVSRHVSSHANHLMTSITSGKVPLRIDFMPQWRQDLLQQDKVEAAHAKSATIVTSPCEDLKKFAAREWNIDPAKLYLTPNPYQANQSFTGIPVRGEGSVVGFVGRLERRKGIETLAKAIPLVLDQFPDATFRLIGSKNVHPDTLEDYEKWIRQKVGKHAARVEFAGKIPLKEMASAYAGLSIAVFPSVWENFPNVCLEAMSAGLPVVASSAGGMSEILNHGECGSLVPPGDSAKLAEAILALLKHPAEKIRLGELARKRVLAVYNHDAIGKLMEQQYMAAIAAHAKN